MSTRQKSTRVFAFAIVGLLSISLAVTDAQETSRTSEAKQLLASSGLSGGLIVHVGCADGKLTAALGAEGNYLVQGLDADPQNVDQARAYVRSQDQYGRVSIDRLTGQRLPYANDLVNLLVVEALGDVPMSEVMRVLAPLGVALVKQQGEWTQTQKAWPAEIDDWTHYQHGPDNNAVAQDTRVGPPQHLQWKAGPLYCRSHYGIPSSIEVVLSANGRLFSIIDEGVIGLPSLPQQWKIVARDAFNGTLLWKIPLASKLSRKRLVAIGDRLYVTLDNRAKLSILDGATGETIRDCDGTDGVTEIISIDEVVVLGVSARHETSIVGVDAISGKVLWKTPAKRVAANSLVAADGRVYYHDGREIVCLDLLLGNELWRAESQGGRRGMLMVYQRSVINTGGGLEVFSVADGRPLWTGPGYVERFGLFGTGGLIWPGAEVRPERSFVWSPEEITRVGLDPETGKLVRSVSVERLITPGHHYRCYPAKATERFILLPKRGVEFLDMTGDEHMRHNWLRAPCRHGTMPANGLLYVPPHQCFCYPGVLLTGFNALAATSDDVPVASNDGPRLTVGPAYDQAVSPSGAVVESSADWPTYRHDPQRSGAIDMTLPVDLEPIWETRIGGRITPPVVADGRLFVAGEDSHTVYCQDAGTGERLWLYTTGGRVDSPPTIHNGRVLFGSTDGSIYCVRATDGELVWRFRAAPEQRRIVVHDEIESAWPVHGSVLVQNDVVYFTAGRSSYLDGGVYMFGLNPTTGAVIHETRLWSARPDVTKDAGRPFDVAGTRTDILVSDGEDLYLYHNRFNADLTRQETPRITKLGDREVSLHLMSNDGFLDKVWFDRSYWTYSKRWPGYYHSYDGPKSGQILVFDDTTTYGVHVFRRRGGRDGMFDPSTDDYELFADHNWAEPVIRPTEIGREKGGGYSRTILPKWSENVLVRIQAMVLTNGRLFVAGPPDIVPPDDPLIAFEDRAGAKLQVVSTEDGKNLAEYDLDRVPSFDGMVAADGRLYITTNDGHVLCMGKR